MIEKIKEKFTWGYSLLNVMLTLHSIVYINARMSTLLFQHETDDLGVVKSRVMIAGMIADAVVLIFILTAREII